MLKRASVKQKKWLKAKKTTKKSPMSPEINGLGRYAEVAIILSRWYIWFLVFMFLWSMLGIIDTDIPETASMISILDILATIILLIGVMVWAYTNYKNLHNMGTEGLKHTASRAIRWWIVPIASWIIPYHIVKDIFTQNYNLFSINNSSIEYEEGIKLIWRWRGLWVICSVLISRWPESDESSFILLPIIGFAISVYLLIRIIKKVSALQSKLKTNV